MRKLACHDCQRYVVAYIHGELKPNLRRRIALHLENCARCQTMYARERALTYELAARIPASGRGDNPALVAIWQAVQSELTAPMQPPRRQRYSLHYGLLVAALLLALTLPWMVNQSHVALASNIEPRPYVAVVVNEPVNVSDATAQPAKSSSPSRPMETAVPQQSSALPALMNTP